jgi:predicted transcriptional regulator
MTERSREEIISLILESAEKGTTQTNLMYETYLSHDAIKGYLKLLLEKGLIEYLAGEMKFKTTGKGAALLSSNSRIDDKACSHQCKKCGVLYCCNKTYCQDPFHHAVCDQCVRFLGRHNSVLVPDVQSATSLPKTYSNSE